MKIFDHFPVVGENLLIVRTKVLSLFLRAAPAEDVGGKNDFYTEAFFPAKLLDPVGHIADKLLAVAFATVALGAEEMMRSHDQGGFCLFHDAVSSTCAFIRVLLSFFPMIPASRILMMAVGMKGRTQAVKAATKLLLAATTNQHIPTM